MKLLIVTDAWRPQINGVVRTLENLISELKNNGWKVRVISHLHPDFKTMPAPKYPEVEFVINPWIMFPLLKHSDADHIHIATEGPLGISARCYCNLYDIPFTTSYHTKTPEYLNQVFKIPLRIGYAFMRWFHKPSSYVFVTTLRMKELLARWKLHDRMVLWTRGVDYDLFNPNKRTRESNPKIKRLICVGRVSIEKNLEAFLSLNIPNTEKVIVGDGPMKGVYEKKYPEVHFTGPLKGESLAREYANADVFVFPSKWDTFGLVQIEAGASSVPVASFINSETKDIVDDGINGWSCSSLEEAIKKCLLMDKNRVREHCMSKFTWKHCALIFKDIVEKTNAVS